MEESQRELRERLARLESEVREVRGLLAAAEARARAAAIPPPRIPSSSPDQPSPAPTAGSSSKLLPEEDPEREAAFGSRGLMAGGAIVTVLGIVTLGTYLSANFRITKEVQWVIELLVCAIVGAVGAWRLNHKGPLGQVLLGSALCGANVSFAAACYDKGLISATILGIAYCVLSWTAFGVAYLKKSEPLWVLGLIGAGASLTTGGDVEWLRCVQLLALAAPASAVAAVHRWRGWAGVLGAAGFVACIALSFSSSFLLTKDGSRGGGMPQEWVLYSFLIAASWLVVAGGVIASRREDDRPAPSSLYLLMPLGVLAWHALISQESLYQAIGVGIGLVLYTAAAGWASRKLDRHLWVAGGAAGLAALPWIARGMPGALAVLVVVAAVLTASRWVVPKPWALAGALTASGLALTTGALLETIALLDWTWFPLDSRWETLLACFTGSLCLAGASKTISLRSDNRRAFVVAAWMGSAAGLGVGMTSLFLQMPQTSSNALIWAATASAAISLAAYQLSGCQGSRVAAYLLSLSAAVLPMFQLFEPATLQELPAALSCVPIWVLAWMEARKDPKNSGYVLPIVFTCVSGVWLAMRLGDRLIPTDQAEIAVGLVLYSAVAALLGRLKALDSALVMGWLAIGGAVLIYTGVLTGILPSFTPREEMILLPFMLVSVVLLVAGVHVHDTEPGQGTVGAAWAVAAVLIGAGLHRAVWLALIRWMAPSDINWVMILVSACCAMALAVASTTFRKPSLAPVSWIFGCSAMAWYGGTWYPYWIEPGHRAPLLEAGVLAALSLVLWVLSRLQRRSLEQPEALDAISLVVGVGVLGRLAVLLSMAACLDISPAQVLLFTWGFLSLGLCLAGGRYRQAALPWLGTGTGVAAGISFIVMKNPDFGSLSGLVVVSVPAVDISALCLLLIASIAAVWAFLENDVNRDGVLQGFLPVQWLLSAAILMLIAQEPPLRQKFDASMTLSWVCYAAVILVLGLRNNWRVARVFSLLVFFCAFVKVVFYDLTNLDPIVKIVTFLLGGLTMVGLGYLYGKLARPSKESASEAQEIG